MERVLEAVFNPSKSIRHVHCCLSNDSDRHFLLKKQFLEMNLAEDNTWMVGLTSCKYADSVPLLLQSLGECFNIKKESCKNVDDFMDAVNRKKDNLKKKRVLLGVFGAEDLATFNHSALNAFLAIPSSFTDARILTISEVPWGFSEHVESAGSSQPVELFVDDYFAESEVSLITSLTRELDIDQQIVRFVVPTVSAHIIDRRAIAKICKQTADLIANKEFATAKDKQVFLREAVTEIINNFERRQLLLKNNENRRTGETEVLRLPISHQLLLISSFCASHNTPTGDKRFFVKHHGREQRNENRERAVELAAENKDSGPKAVDVQRIYFIYQVFVERNKEDLEQKFERFHMPAGLDILPELYSLENMSLVSRASSFANIDQPKFRCMISYEMAKKIAENLDIKLEDFLERKVM